MAYKFTDPAVIEAGAKVAKRHRAITDANVASWSIEDLRDMHIMRR